MKYQIESLGGHTKKVWGRTNKFERKGTHTKKTVGKNWKKTKKRIVRT